MGMSAAHCQGISECLESGHPEFIQYTADQFLLKSVNICCSYAQKYFGCVLYAPQCCISAAAAVAVVVVVGCMSVFC